MADVTDIHKRITPLTLAQDMRIHEAKSALIVLERADGKCELAIASGDLKTALWLLGELTSVIYSDNAQVWDRHGS